MKKRFSRVFLVLSAFCIALLCGHQTISDEKSGVREAAVAGQFYPAQPDELRKMLDDLLAQASVPLPSGRIVALIAPHAGYIYSGKVAAYSYALLQHQKFERVVVIAPSHFEGFPYISVFNGDAYATPLGIVPVDKDFAAKLAKMDPLIQISSRGHTPTQQGGEHALEVQLPFLQHVLGNFRLVPIVMGEQSYETERALGVALAKMVKGTNSLILASSDLSHYHTYDQAVKLDQKVLKSIEHWDYLSLSQNLQGGRWEACGGGPIVAAMIAAEKLGAKEARILKYANSGDTTGDRSRVVGYSAVALLQADSHSGKSEPYSIPQKEKDALLALARKSVETAVKEKKLYEPQASDYSVSLQERGVFVTLKKKGELRGCIGLITPEKPLYIGVRDAATYAALEDPRFSPVIAAELPDLHYEISVLTPFHRVLDVKEVQVGRDGLLMIQGRNEGVLLPQVPTEQGWDRKTFLEETCLKAGLPPHAWQDEATDIYSFSAIVFGEQKLPEPLPLEKPTFQKPKEPPGPPGLDSPRP
ncbi:MAG TPA: AmmeMemoRadiSam system protein B [Candidatus Limnocylindrales bacterium]|nr:AmmeMemoRadiSam system protein B [Candidatus Limnocylindrales bacterium]